MNPTEEYKVELLRIQHDALKLIQKEMNGSYGPHSNFIIEESRWLIAFCKDVLGEKGDSEEAINE